MSETPRTDKAAILLDDGDRKRLGVDWESSVDGEFANKMERELAAVTAERDELKKKFWSHPAIMRVVAERDAAMAALRSISEDLEKNFLLNEEIVAEVMRDDYTLACKIGGDEASISTWAAIARRALNPNP